MRADNKVVCWGSNKLHAPDYDFQTVDVSDHFACGVRTNGKVACWGENHSGSAEPPDNQFLTVSVGEFDHACGVLTNGKILCWGNEDRTGNVPSEGRFTAVDAGSRACALRDDGAIICW